MPQPPVKTYSRYVELEPERKIYHSNKLDSRFNRWPICMFVFFIALASFPADALKFAMFVCIPGAVSEMAQLHLLSRTKPIMLGELAVLS
jgi:hypothetical protein